MRNFSKVINDIGFRVYYNEDERSAAYMACGLASEYSTPIVLCCSEATASRNFYSGLTEAYYRQLPILVVTFSQGDDCIGHLLPQNIDRHQLPNDLVKMSVDIPMVVDERSDRYARIEINKSILRLSQRGGGPSHINLQIGDYSYTNSVILPQYNYISHYSYTDDMPALPDGPIAVYIGAHHIFSEQENNALDSFCTSNKAVVLCTQISNYYGRFRKDISELNRHDEESDTIEYRLLIHIGEVSAKNCIDHISAKEVWRVNPDGELRNPFGCLNRIFEMDEEFFFVNYTKKCSKLEITTAQNRKLNILQDKSNFLKNMDYGGLWVAQETIPFIPKGSKVHIGVGLLKVWDMFELSINIECFSNVGGYSSDGALSCLIGASLVNTKRLYLGIFEQRTLFYDMNSVGNRHVGNNVRIMIVNDNKSRSFQIQQYVENLGYKYFSVFSKEDYLRVKDEFLSIELSDKPIILDVFI